MRSRLLIFLLFLLPLQLTTAAVASYCQFEQGAAAAHFGHHEHQHHGGKANADNSAEAPDKSNTSSQLGGVDDDCAVCNLSATSALPVKSDLRMAHRLDPPPAFDAARYRSPVPIVPERPVIASPFNSARAVTPVRTPQVL